MNEPKSRIPDELLSAYLDGELSPAEQEQVDHALASDLGLQALLTELRQVRSDLQLLPRHRLPPSFSDRVLRSCGKHDTGSSVVARISVRTRRRRIVATLLAIAATVMIAAWATGPMRWGGPAIPRQVATHAGRAATNGRAANRADRSDSDADTLSLDWVETEEDVRRSLRSEFLKKVPRTESLARDSLATASGGITALDAGAAAPTQLGRRPNVSQSKSTAVEEQLTAADAKALVARVELTVPIQKVELTFPLETIAQIKAQLQGPQTTGLGLKVTDLLRTPYESLYSFSTGHLASPLEKEELNEEVVSSRGLNEIQPENQVADADGAVRPDALFFGYENVQLEELLLVEGTQDQIATAVRQLNVVSTNISDLTAKQLVFVSPPGGGGGIGLRSEIREIQDSNERSAGGGRQARSRRALDRVGDALPSQQTANEPAKDARLADVADESKDDDANSRTGFAAAAPTDQTDTPFLSRKSAAVSGRAKGASTSGEQPNRELEEVTGAKPRYRVLFVLLREESK